MVPRATDGAMAEEERLRVLIVDDHEVVQWGFRVLLSEQSWVERCVAAPSAERALEIARKLEPHVALIDLFLGEQSGAELCETLRRASPRTRVLLISGAGSISPEAARAAGASGFVLKDWSAPDVARAVRMVGKGMTVFATRSEDPATELSAREREVLSLMAGRRHQQGDRRPPLPLPAHRQGPHQRALPQARGAQPGRGGAAGGAPQPDLEGGARTPRHAPTDPPIRGVWCPRRVLDGLPAGLCSPAMRDPQSTDAVLFPGQGSQTADMRRTVEVFWPDLLELAAEAVGADPFERIEEGTRYAQPAIFCAAMAGWRAIARRGRPAGDGRSLAGGDRRPGRRREPLGPRTASA